MKRSDQGGVTRPRLSLRPLVGRPAGQIARRQVWKQPWATRVNQHVGGTGKERQAVVDPGLSLEEEGSAGEDATGTDGQRKSLMMPRAARLPTSFYAMNAARFPAHAGQLLSPLKTINISQRLKA